VFRVVSIVNKKKESLDCVLNKEKLEFLIVQFFKVSNTECEI